MKALALVVLLGCVHALPGPAQLRALPDQSGTAVIVDVECDSESWEMGMRGGVGSGVVVTSRHVLTALHVAEPCFSLPTVHVVFEDGTRWRMVVSKWLAHDVALLERADAGQWDFTRPVVREPHVGDPVCMVSAFPRFARTCGVVLGFTASPNRFAMRSGTSVAGNSGSAVYSTDGALVGIHSNHSPAFVPMRPEWIP